MVSFTGFQWKTIGNQWFLDGFQWETIGNHWIFGWISMINHRKPLAFHRETSKDLQHHLKSSPNHFIWGRGSHFFRFGGFPKPSKLLGGSFINPVLSLLIQFAKMCWLPLPLGNFVGIACLYSSWEVLIDWSSTRPEIAEDPHLG